jgi:hypothetical protein
VFVFVEINLPQLDFHRAFSLFGFRLITIQYKENTIASVFKSFTEVQTIPITLTDVRCAVLLLSINYVTFHHDDIVYIMLEF